MVNSMFKKFKVARKVKENDIVTSFYLKPVDNTYELKEHKAGQFINIKPIKEGDDANKIRQYSLSMKPGSDYYRISVKKEYNGIVSNYLHEQINDGDIVDISDPAGRFTLEESDKPLVLISGGIGVTPEISMLYKGIETNRNIIFIQAVANSAAHTFKEEVEKIKAEYKNITKYDFYSEPLDTDIIGKDYDYKGFITKGWIDQTLPKNGDYYFCGPIPFMKFLYDSLIECGISKENIHYEAFGPAKDLSKL